MLINHKVNRLSLIILSWVLLVACQSNVTIEEIVVNQSPAYHKSPLERPDVTSVNDAAEDIYLPGVSPEVCLEVIEPVLRDAELFHPNSSSLQGMGTMRSKDRGFVNEESTEHPTRILSTAGLDSYALAIANYWIAHPEESFDDLKKWASEQGYLCVPHDQCTDAVEVNWNRGARTEFVLTIHEPTGVDNRFESLCGRWYGAQRTYLFDCQSSPADCLISHIGRLYNVSSCIHQVSDINRDQSPEIIVTYNTRGGSVSKQTLEIIGWTKQKFFEFQYLTPAIEVSNGCLLGRDYDQDGILEFFTFSSDLPNSLGFLYTIDGRPNYGPLPNIVNLYTWDGAQYILFDKFYSLDCQYHYVRQGIERFQDGDPQRALEVFQEILRNPDVPERCRVEGDKQFPWRVYAQLAIGILSAQMGQIDEAITLLNQIEGIDTDNIFSPAAKLFAAALETNSPQQACSMLNRYYETQPPDALIYGPYVEMPLINLCETINE